MRASPAPQPQPLGVALGVGEAGVEQRHLVAEAGPEAAGELRGQRDLGHQHQRPLAGGARRGDGPQVDLGLARAGDAVEQEGAEAAEGPGHRGQGRGLITGQLDRAIRGGQHAALRHRRLGVEHRQAALAQLSQRGAGGREGGPQLLDRDPAARQQVLEHGALRPGPAQRRQGLVRARRRGGVLDAPPVRTGHAAAGVEARGEGGPEQLAGRDQVVGLGPAEQLDQPGRERREGVEHLHHVAQLEAGRRGRPGSRPRSRWRAGSGRTGPPPAAPATPRRPASPAPGR